MFNVGAAEIALIFRIAILVFGPSKLGELGKAAGKGIAEFKKATQEVKDALPKE